jgi:hypothetical protein
MRRAPTALKHVDVACKAPVTRSNGSGVGQIRVIYCARDLHSMEVVHGQSGREEEGVSEAREEEEDREEGSPSRDFETREGEGGPEGTAPREEQDGEGQEEGESHRQEGEEGGPENRSARKSRGPDGGGQEDRDGRGSASGFAHAAATHARTAASAPADGCPSGTLEADTCGPRGASVTRSSRTASASPHAHPVAEAHAFHSVVGSRLTIPGRLRTTGPARSLLAGPLARARAPYPDWHVLRVAPRLDPSITHRRWATMRNALVLALLAGGIALGAPEDTRAQGLIAVGEMAPDFELPGATRYGALAEPVTLSDYRGETVVLAFFFRVRTPG